MATSEEVLQLSSDTDPDDAKSGDCGDGEAADGESDMGSLEGDEEEEDEDGDSFSEEESEDSESEGGESDNEEDQSEAEEEEGQISSSAELLPRSLASLPTTEDQAESIHSTAGDQSRDAVVSTTDSLTENQPETTVTTEASAAKENQLEETDDKDIEKVEPSTSEKKAKKPRKRKAKAKTNEDGQTKKKSKDDKEKRGKKRKRKEKTEDGEKRRKTTFERRNIRKILKDQSLDEETIKAQKEEMERKKRLAEKLERLKGSQLQTLLDDDSASDNEPPIPTPVAKPKKKEDVVTISSDEDDDDDDELDKKSSEDEREDPENSGSHVNDAMNQPDTKGQVLVNVGHPPKEPDIYLPPQLAANVKPHQIGGIRFLYDNVVESLEQYKSGTGLGCILAHSMGLGKTLQVISFSDVVLRNTSGKRVLIIVPVNTLQNWMSEFNMWLPDRATLISQYRKARAAERKAEEERLAAELAQREQPDSTTETDLGLDLPAGIQGESVQLSDEMKADIEQITFDTKLDFGVDTSSSNANSPEFAPVEALADIKLDNLGPQLDGQSDPKPEPHVTSTTLPPPPAPMNIPTPRPELIGGYNGMDPQMYYGNGGYGPPPHGGNNGGWGHYPPPPPHMNHPYPPQPYMWPPPPPGGMGNHPSAPPQGNYPPPQHMPYGPMPPSHTMSNATTSQPNSIPPISLPPSNQTKPKSNSVKSESKSSSRSSTPSGKKSRSKQPKNENSDSEDSKQSADSCFKRPKDDPPGRPEVKEEEEEPVPESVFKDVWPREFKVFLVNDSQKTNAARAKVVGQWFKEGGVLLMGYEMYRLLTSKRVCTKPKKSRSQLAKEKEREKEKDGSEPVTIDLVEEEKNTELLTNLQDALVNPGPDLIICDEGHRIKNSHTGISQSLKNIKTRRRVVLTGYPLQNNLLEYWCMVDFVRPNFLGTKTEFCNMFERPIMNGQCQDSTPQDVRLMRFRAHVLHSLLEGFVQRRSAEVLTKALPPKEESVLLVKMSPIQRRLYKAFMDIMGDVTVAAWANANPLKAFSVCCKIWNHPDILHQIIEQRKLEENDLDIEDKDDVTGGNKNKSKARMKKSASTASIDSNASTTSTTSMESVLGRDQDKVITYDWAEEIMKTYEPEHLENGGKMLILFSIIQQSISLGEKVLVFSQSLFTLSLIEKFLSKKTVPWPQGNTEMWSKNKNYFRLDGSTSSTEREKLINNFNGEANSNIHLFLLSTRAGCLGINLIGANRVVIFDASWNPCHDCQAVCRVYRYGQQKSCYIYRLVTDNTMEKKIYDRQIGKQGISDRVVDELNPNNHMTRKQVDVLLEYEDKDPPEITPETAETYPGDDPVLYNVLTKHYSWITKVPFNHDQLLADNQAQRLTKSEKKLARQGYEMEKKLSVGGYSRPSYQAFYPKTPGSVGGAMDMSRLMKRPMLVNRSPMMTTPIPMRTAAAQKPSASPALLKPGVSVQQIKLTTDIPIPGATQGITRIPAGETVLVIRTPKGVYIRTPQGKIFAVRSTPKGTDLASGKATGEDRKEGEGGASGEGEATDLATLATSKPKMTITLAGSTESGGPRIIKTMPKIIVQPKSGGGGSATTGEMPKGTIVNIVPRVTKQQSGTSPSIIHLRPSLTGKGNVIVKPQIISINKASHHPSGAQKPKTVIIHKRNTPDNPTTRITLSNKTITDSTNESTSPNKKSNSEIVAEMLEKLQKGKKEDAVKARREDNLKKQREERERRQREMLLEMEKDPSKPALSPPPPPESARLHDDEDSDTSDSAEEWMEQQLNKMREQQAKLKQKGAASTGVIKTGVARTGVTNTGGVTTTGGVINTEVTKTDTQKNASEKPPVETSIQGHVNKTGALDRTEIDKLFNSDSSDDSEEFERLYEESLRKSMRSEQNNSSQSAARNGNNKGMVPILRQNSSSEGKVSNEGSPAFSRQLSSNIDPMSRPNPRANKPALNLMDTVKPSDSLPPKTKTKGNTKATKANSKSKKAPQNQPKSQNLEAPMVGKQPASAVNASAQQNMDSAITMNSSNQNQANTNRDTNNSQSNLQFTNFSNQNIIGQNNPTSMNAFNQNLPPPQHMSASGAGAMADKPDVTNNDIADQILQDHAHMDQGPPVIGQSDPKTSQSETSVAPPEAPAKKKRAPRKPKDPNAPKKKPGPKPKNKKGDTAIVEDKTQLESNTSVSDQVPAPGDVGLAQNTGYNQTHQQMGQGQNQPLPGQSQMTPGQPPMFQGQYQMPPGQSEMCQGQPQMPQGQPQIQQGQPQIPQGQPQMSQGHPQMQSGQTQLPHVEASQTQPTTVEKKPEKKKRAPRKPKDPNAPKQKPGRKPKKQPTEDANQAATNLTEAQPMAGETENKSTNQKGPQGTPGQTADVTSAEVEPTPGKKKRAPRKPKDPNAPPKPRKPRKKKGETEPPPETSDAPVKENPANEPAENANTVQSAPTVADTSNASSGTQQSYPDNQNSANNQPSFYQPWNNQTYNQTYPGGQTQGQMGAYQPWDSQAPSGVTSQQGQQYNTLNQAAQPSNQQQFPLPNQQSGQQTGQSQPGGGSGMYQPWNMPNTNQYGQQNQTMQQTQPPPPSKTQPNTGQQATTASANTTTAAIPPAQSQLNSSSQANPNLAGRNDIISIDELTKDDSGDNTMDNSDFLSSDSSEMMEFINEGVKKYGHLYQPGAVTSTAPAQTSGAVNHPGTQSAAPMGGAYPPTNYNQWGMPPAANPYPQYGYSDYHSGYGGYPGYQAGYGWPPMPHPPVTQPLTSSGGLYGAAIKPEPGSATSASATSGLGGTSGLAANSQSESQAWMTSAYGYQTPGGVGGGHYGVPPAGAQPYYMNPAHAPPPGQPYPGQPPYYGPQ